MNEILVDVHCTFFTTIEHFCLLQGYDPDWCEIPDGPTGFEPGYGTWCKRGIGTRWHRLRLGCQVCKDVTVIVHKSLVLFK